MDENLKQELLKRLDLLAEKLGTTTEYVFSIYVKQASVEVVQGLIIAALPLLGVAACAMLLRPAYRAWRRDSDFIPAVVFTWMGILGGLTLSVSILSGVLTPWLNPEYWAFQQILSQLK